MKLQFLVNHCQEPPGLVSRLLDSISVQDGLDPAKDYSVLICDDGGENALENRLFDKFPFDVEYIVMPHRGVCATRNTLLDAATAEYVMFCDADDCFHKSNGAQTLLTAANKTNADFVSAPFNAERKNGETFTSRLIPHNQVWIHGKLFRRRFLVENDIRFPEEVESSGDMAFVWQAFHMARNKAFLKDSFYTWKWNSNSLMRNTPHARTRFYGDEIRAYTALTDKLLAIQREDLYQQLILSLISSMYIHFRFKRYGNAPQEYVDNAICAAKEYIRKYADYYDGTDERIRYRIYKAVSAGKHLQGADDFPGIQKWIEVLKNE